MAESTSVTHNIVSCQYEENWTRRVVEAVGGNHELEVKWRVLVDKPDISGPIVLKQLREIQAAKQTANIAKRPYDPIPVVGINACLNPQGSNYYGIAEYYNHLGKTEVTTFCVSVVCELIDPKDPLQYQVTAVYRQPEDSGSPLVYKEPLDDNPWKWPPLTWIEYIEDQTVVEVARCFGSFEPVSGAFNTPGKFIDLTHLVRGVSFPTNDPGPIVNAAGQQTIDPQMELNYRTIYNIKVNYPNHFYAMKLNRIFSKTMHGPDDYLYDPIAKQWEATTVPLLLNHPHGTWKYLLAQPDPVVYKNYNGTIVSYCPTTIKFEIKWGELVDWTTDGNGDPIAYYYSGWNRLVLNNGQVCFRKMEDKHLDPQGNKKDVDKEVWIRDPRVHALGGTFVTTSDGSPLYKLLFPTQVMKIRPEKLSNFKWDDKRDPSEYTAQSRAQPDEEVDMEEAETAEPVNLKLDGTQITNPEEKPIHIWYNNLKPRDYNAITNYYGEPLIKTSWYSGETDPNFSLVKGFVDENNVVHPPCP